jgi:hypothetical protein
VSRVNGIMSAQDNFWLWFGDHEEMLFSFDPKDTDEREKLFYKLAEQLHKIHPNLVFEFAPNAPQREFVISADGIKDAFPSVVSLAKTAPALHRWKIIAFRPRRDPINSVEIAGNRVDPRQVKFSLLDNGTTAGIYLFIPDFQDNDIALKQIGYLMLDEALGEYDVETRVGLIKMFTPEAVTVGERHSLTELPRLFDKLASILEQRTRKPS